MSTRVRILARKVLHIAKVTRADKGMYQCVAFNDYDSAQAQVQLELGGENHFYNYGQVSSTSFKRPERDLGQNIVHCNLRLIYVDCFAHLHLAHYHH